MTAAVELEAQRSVTHGTFTLERTYPQSPQAVFDAWATRDSKYEWFAQGISFLRSVEAYDLDFRVGGVERLEGTLARSGNRFEYHSVYADIVPGRRIVAAYDVLIGGRRISASLLTVEFEPSGSASGSGRGEQASEGGTRLVLTEQGAFFDGLDSNEERLVGATESLDGFGRFLGR